MSEELAGSVTQGQDLTQDDRISSTNLLFSPANGPVFYGLNAEQAQELVKKGNINPTMVEQETEFKCTMATRPDWIFVNGYRDLKYYVDGEKLHVKCRGSCIETTWEQMIEFSKLSQGDYEEARDKLLLESRIIRNTDAATALNKFTAAIRRGFILPPGGKPVASEKPVEFESRPGTKVFWTQIPRHPQLKYREEAGHLILNYAGSIVSTTWDEIEKTSRLETKLWRHCIEKIVGNIPTRGRKEALGLFLKLVESGKVARVTISQFGYEEKVSV